jgi:hypothetical protein
MSCDFMVLTREKCQWYGYLAREVPGTSETITQRTGYIGTIHDHSRALWIRGLFTSIANGLHRPFIISWAPKTVMVVPSSSAG